MGINRSYLAAFLFVCHFDTATVLPLYAQLGGSSYERNYLLQSTEETPTPPVTIAGGTIRVRRVDAFTSQQREDRILSFMRQPIPSTVHCRNLLDLQAVLNSIAKTFVNRRALEDQGFDDIAEIEIDGDLTAGLPLAAALDRVLAPHHLVWEIRSGYIEITTCEHSEENLSIRVYDVTPLICHQIRRDGQGKKVGKVASFDPLLNLLQMNVASESWDTMGGMSVLSPIVIGNRGFLVATTSTQIHLQIEALLNQLNQLGFSH